MPNKDPFILGKKTVMGASSTIETEAGAEIIAVDSSGTATIKADIKDTLAQGSIYIGNASGVTSELSAKADTKILVGNGTTAAMQSLSGDATMTNAGVVTVTGSTGAFAATGDLTNASGDITSTKTDDGAAGATITARQVSASPAGSDIPGSFNVEGKDDGGNDTTYAQFQGVIQSPTDGAEISSANVNVQNGTGSLTNVATFEHDGTNKVLQTGLVRTASNIGTPGTGVTAFEYGDGKSHVTVLSMTSQAVDPPTAAAAEAHGHLLYTFPAGAHLHEVTYMDIALQGGGTVDTDTPDVGIGSVIASGAQALLSGVGATSEDYITGQTATNCSGTATVVGPVGAVAGVLTGISLNTASDAKTVHLNYADTWAGADTLAATGTVVLKWTSIA